MGENYYQQKKDIYLIGSGNANHQIYENIFNRIISIRNIKKELNCKYNFLSPIIYFYDSKSSIERLKFNLDSAVQNKAWRIIILLDSITKLDINIYKLLSKYDISDIIQYSGNEKYIDRINNHLKRWDEIDEILLLEETSSSLVGKSKIWIKFLSDAIESALYSDASVLIIGETGTGKELIANLIHSIYNKRNLSDDFIIVDSTNLSKELAGSELFGHEKGSFTNAIYTRDGAVSLADNGTLFLDEIGELSKDLQSMFLRVIQEGRYKRIGSSIWRSSFFHLISATSRNLEEEINKGNFREDLFYRISGNVFRVPSLKERKEDIPLLVNHFLCEFLHTDIPPPLDVMTQDYLFSRNYPGNVRELEQLVKRIAYKYIGPGNINICNSMEKKYNEYAQEQNQYQIPSYENVIRKLLNEGVSLQEIKNKIVNASIRIALEESNGVVTEAARKLQVSTKLIQIRNHGNDNIERIN